MPAPRVMATPKGQEDSYPAQDVTFPNGVRGKPGLVYREAMGYRALTLDLYLPPRTVRRPAQGFPLVIFIHGGAFLVGDPRHNPPFADFPGVLASLSARGYVVASVEYRLSGEAVFPAAIRDVKAAIRWLRSQASNYEIDPARAMAWGASAGGNLAGLAAVSCHVPLLEPVTKDNDISDCVQGAVSWYGVFDIATLASQAQQENGGWRSVRDFAGVSDARLLCERVQSWTDRSSERGQLRQYAGSADAVDRRGRGQDRALSPNA